MVIKLNLNPDEKFLTSHDTPLRLIVYMGTPLLSYQ